MKKIFYLLLFFYFISCVSFAQRKSNTIPDKSIIEKWAKAIINIECRPNKDYKDLNNMVYKYERKEITLKELTDFSTKYTLEIDRYTGTAIFLKYDTNYYLVTARHVIEDVSTSRRKHDLEPIDYIFDNIFLIANGSQLAHNDTIAHDSHSHDEILLMNYNSGTSYDRPFSFSSKEDDLAILKIGPDSFRGVEFLGTLFKRGYVPVELRDIDQKCQIREGEEIISFGFTGDASIIGRKKLSVAEFSWESDLISLPIVSKGTVASNVLEKKMFSGNIFVHHGNSGGPVVSNGKLVGIVSNTAVPLVKMETSSLEYYLSREINFIKSSLIVPMLIDLEERLASPWEYMQKRRNPNHPSLINKK